LVGEPEGKTPLGRPRLGWEDNIKMVVKVIGWEGVDRDQWRSLVNTVMNLAVA
jgi:hypothetical protein